MRLLSNQLIAFYYKLLVTQLIAFFHLFVLLVSSLSYETSPPNNSFQPKPTHVHHLILLLQYLVLANLEGKDDDLTPAASPVPIHPMLVRNPKNKKRCGVVFRI